ncbi:MAG: hypothetical protein Fur006_31000 [Coleofasciculaceae cyanobacterium]
MGGVGKTELAIQYAKAHRESYKGGICWLEARSGDVGAQIVQFARSQLNLSPPQDLDLAGQVAFCWQHWPVGEADKVLVVLDDVENVTDYKQVKPYLPPQLSRFKVLMTTRSDLGPSIAKLPLDVLQLEAAHELLQSIVGEERLQQEPEVANKLCEWLGRLPLGLELVGRYLEPDPDLSLEEMLSRLEAKRLKHRSLIEADPTMTAKLGVAAALELTWERFDPSAQQLACLLSLFASAPIPWSLVERVEKGQDREDLECARKALVRSHFLKRPGEKTYQEHRLIWEFLQDKQKESAQATDLKKAFATAMVEVASEIPKTLTPDKIAEVAPYIPHVAKAATDLTDLKAEEQVCIFRGLGRYYQAQGDYDQAENWLNQCLSISQTPGLTTAIDPELLPDNHMSLARSMTAIDIDPELLPDNHMSLARSMTAIDIDPELLPVNQPNDPHPNQDYNKTEFQFEEIFELDEGFDKRG